MRPLHGICICQASNFQSKSTHFRHTIIVWHRYREIKLNFFNRLLKWSFCALQKKTFSFITFAFPFSFRSFTVRRFCRRMQFCKVKKPLKNVWKVCTCHALTHAKRKLSERDKDKREYISRIFFMLCIDIIWFRFFCKFPLVASPCRIAFAIKCQTMRQATICLASYSCKSYDIGWWVNCTREKNVERVSALHRNRKKKRKLLHTFCYFNCSIVCNVRWLSLRPQIEMCSSSASSAFFNTNFPSSIRWRQWDTKTRSETRRQLCVEYFRTFRSAVAALNHFQCALTSSTFEQLFFSRHRRHLVCCVVLTFRVFCWRYHRIHVNFYNFSIMRVITQTISLLNLTMQQ